MRIKYRDLEIEGVTYHSGRAPLSSLAALQRETGWSMAKIDEMRRLEFVAMQLAVFVSWRAAGRSITFATAGEMLDECEFVVEDGDAAATVGGDVADPPPAAVEESPAE